MNALQIKLTGEITATNFQEWKTELLAQIAASKRELKTDDHFVEAEMDVKAIKAGEKSLKEAKTSALEQAAEIQQLFAAIDEVTEEARQARLALERQIRARKEEIKEEIVADGIEQLQEFIDKQSELFQSVNKQNYISVEAFEEAAKGKRTAKSLTQAVSKVVSAAQAEINTKIEAIDSNLHLVKAIDEDYKALFQDTDALLDLDQAILKTTISERIDFYKEEQERQRAEAEEQAAREAERDAEKARMAEATVSAPEAKPQEEEELQEEEPEHSGNGINASAVFVISIEVFAEEGIATEFHDELEGRYAHREMIGEIKLVPS